MAHPAGNGSRAQSAPITTQSTSNIIASIKDEGAIVATRLLAGLIQKDQYVGETWQTDYDQISVQIHDFFRNQAGGIPQGAFLIATRIEPGTQVEQWNAEDASIILLRVKGRAPLWNESETDKIRVEAGQRATGVDGHWDDERHMDAYTHQAFAFGGLRCAVLGTYFLKRKPDAKDDSELMLAFGSDIANFYPNRGLKVYKPVDNALERLVNYRDAARIADHPLGEHVVRVGRVRYTSTERSGKGLDNVPVYFSPVDLLGQKTALFGMTRIGKSNTTKTLAKAIYVLRTQRDAKNAPGPTVGQLIFDANGEYANENYMDAGTGASVPTALRNVWKLAGREDDVVVYGQTRPDYDPNRRITKINFYDNGPMLNVGKQLINDVLEEQGVSAQYVRSFVAVEFEDPGPGFGGPQTRFNRNLLAYRSLLHAAGFAVPAGLEPSTKGLFGDIIDVMKMPKQVRDFGDPADEKAEKRLAKLKDHVAMEDLRGEAPDDYFRAANIFESEKPTWTAITNAFTILNTFIHSKTYKRWNETYAATSSSGSDWHDALLQGILGMFKFGAIKVMKEVTMWHEPGASNDYVDEIYKFLEEGRLVIVDQSLGDPELNAHMAERIAHRIFRGNSRKFATGKKASDMSMLIYIEEAHNLLPDSQETDTKNIWSRIVKEGGKFGIGVVYATQEPSSIQGNILKNTANWFVGHLSSTEETRQISKSYDFADFEKSILHAQDRGFMRVKTLSNSFVIPVQIDRFEV